MSITTAFFSSVTSLDAQQTQINTISNNVANANTTGYSSENVQLSALVYGGVGGGVLAGTVQRVSNQSLTAANNQATSAASYSATMTSALTTYTDSLNQTDAATTNDPNSTTSNVLSSAMSEFQNSLVALSASPGDTTAQSTAVNAAGDLVNAFHTLDGAVQSGREDADAAIATGVSQVNTDLNALATNQRAMLKAQSLGQSTAPFQDTQDKLVADISSYIPVNVLPNKNGDISLTTDGGTTLYQNGQVSALSFSPTSNIPDTLGVTANATLGISAGLSQVTVNGSPIQMSDNGSIAANLNLRDNVLPQFADQLNQLAGNVISTFQSSSTDPSVASGQTGLFTISGSALTASSTTAGLASNIALNANVDPSQGGNVWAIQAGAQATSPGQASDTTTVNDYIAAVNNSSSSYTADSGLPSSMTMMTAASQISGVQQTAYSTWSNRNDTRQAQSGAAQTSLTNAVGVNVDEQMQRLLLVQQTYSASAQVLQAASQMLNTINSMAATAIG